MPRTTPSPAPEDARTGSDSAQQARRSRSANRGRRSDTVRSERYKEGPEHHMVQGIIRSKHHTVMGDIDSTVFLLIATLQNSNHP